MLKLDQTQSQTSYHQYKLLFVDTICFMCIGYTTLNEFDARQND